MVGLILALLLGCSADNELGGGGPGGRRDAGPGGGEDSGGGGGVDAGGGPRTAGAMRSCYPGDSVGMGCMPGMESCGELGAWGPCEGAVVPMEGATACCEALESGLTHDMLAM